MSSFVSTVSQEMNVAANALRRITIVASSVNSARCIDVETLGIDG
jgi:hypothetical protein